MISVGVENLVKRFGETVALNHVDLRIEPGELFFLLGPSGCGKTTLLRSIAGFYLPEEGRILFGDKDVSGVPAHKRDAAMVFQSYALWPHMTVEQNVAFGLKQRKVSRRERKKLVTEALESVQMGQYAARRPTQLSGGQQQRVALARALVVRPKCLLLDEPLSNLDAKLRLEMRHEIRRVCKEHNLTAVYVTHDQKEAMSVADRIAVLDNGKVLQVGRPFEVYRRPVNSLIAGFLGETNFIKGRIIRSGGGMASVDTPLGQLQGVLSDQNGDAPEDGAECTVSVRPECLRLEQMAADENCFAGHIGGVSYYGELARYEFVVGEHSLRVFEMNPRFLGRGGEGDLYAFADPEDVVILSK